MNVIIKAILELSQLIGGKRMPEIFNSESGLAVVWATLVQDGRESFDSVPDIENLRDVVAALIEEYDNEVKNGNDNDN
jgi:hypothetical protein